MTLHFFNPSHDEALAAHHPTYCPTKAARRLGATLSDLPRWWAAEGDIILRLPVSMSTAEVGTLPWDVITRIDPWGWDLHVVTLLRRLGAPDRLLPSRQWLDGLRTLSSRRSTVELLRWLHAQEAMAGVLAAESHWCTSVEEVERALAAVGGLAMVKLPWSCSGRGVIPHAGAIDDLLLARLHKAFREQGAVEVQRRYERLSDWALEFVADAAGEVRYLGLGASLTGDGGQFVGQRIAAPAMLETQFVAQWRAVCPTLSPEAFPALVERLERGLMRLLAGGYRGALGVDLLLTPQGLHPCIEINLRRTMGHVALSIAAAQPSAEERVLLITAEGARVESPLLTPPKEEGRLAR